MIDGVNVHSVIDQAHSAIEPGKKISMWKFHQITGHNGEHVPRPTAKYMNIELTGKLAPCDICAQAKIRQANVPKKKMKKVPSRPGYRVFIDICSIKHVSRWGNRHWMIAVGEFSDCSHSFFMSMKSDQIKMIPMWIKRLSNKFGIEIKRIRLDNSGENRSLQKECDKQNISVIFELTAPGTPQQNSVVQRKIKTLVGRAKAMLIQAGIKSKEKGEFWCEVISTATNFDIIMMRPDRTKPPYMLFYNKDANFMKHLRCFGQMAVVAICEGGKMRSKLDNRGKICMFVGYVDDHSGDVYRVLTIKTKRIIMSRHARWLNIIWKHYRTKNIYARRQVELLLDEEERSIQEEYEPAENIIDGDGNNTPTQRKLCLVIGMIGAR